MNRSTATNQQCMTIEPYTKLLNKTLASLYKEPNTVFKVAVFFIQKLQNRKKPFAISTNYINKILGIRWNSILKAIKRLEELSTHYS